MIDDSDGLLLLCDPRQPAALTACRSLRFAAARWHAARRRHGNNNGSDKLLLLCDPRQPAAATACSSSAIRGSPSQGRRATRRRRGSDELVFLCDPRQRRYPGPLRFAPAQRRDGVPLVDAAATTACHLQPIHSCNGLPFGADPGQPGAAMAWAHSGEGCATRE
ncbi:hypothetical protein PR202_ga00085 [Eleusine coracana subsp. coracana]|uniref:Uncharacterized protein n=1 Tax=Eleusine coracana subsp. coracana TaxID=191504 RepID=A0AAV5BG52_ELECO|nr:hypothetical protein PR202_ga00085 [Eleusine coracana subsp. coracana]